jgi:hypothetical protein
MATCELSVIYTSTKLYKCNGEEYKLHSTKGYFKLYVNGQRKQNGSLTEGCLGTVLESKKISRQKIKLW